MVSIILSIEVSASTGRSLETPFFSTRKATGFTVIPAPDAPPNGL